MTVRDWVEPMLREWGNQRLRVMTGKLVRRDGSVHEDGWPKSSVAAAAREGGITGGSGSSSQHFSEVYTGDAYVVWRALQGAPIEVREILHLHYVVKFGERGEHLNPGAKARILGVSRAKYFIWLSEAQSYIAGRIDAVKAETTEESADAQG